MKTLHFIVSVCGGITIGLFCGRVWRRMFRETAWTDIIGVSMALVIGVLWIAALKVVWPVP